MKDNLRQVIHDHIAQTAARHVLPVTEISDEGGVQGADVGMFEGPAAVVAAGPWW